jgi:spore germination protein GerM
MSACDERKIKELADRLVAMSPEPPPFPEEVAVTRRDKPKPSPILVFAGTALVVLILAAIPILLSRGGGEVEPIATTTTTTLPRPETTLQQATITTQAGTTTTEPAPTTLPAQEADAVVYLVQSPENSFTGNPALVPFQGVVTLGAEPVPAALPGLYALTSPGLVLPDGFANMVPVDVEVFGVSTVDNVITLDMNEAFIEGAGGLLADFTMLNQLIYTASHFGEIELVQFTVNGEPVDPFGSEGLDISEPLGPDAFLDQVNSVLVTSPVNGEGDSPLMVSGVANVFEATVSLEVIDADGNVVHEDFTTATCGTGCWGAYTFEVDYPFTGEETIRVFWHSPEDGEPADVVSIPVLWNDDDGWDLLGR